MISFGGLASGLDTGSLIDALVGVERSRASALTRRQSFASQRLAVVKDISEGLDALSDAADDFNEANEIRSLSTTSSSEAVEVTQGEGALAGTYDLSVINLARAETSRSFAFNEDAAGVFTGSGTLGITVGSETEIAVDYDATMSLTDLAAAINASDAAVSASVLYDGAQYRLQVTSEGTGTENALSFTDTGGETGLTDGAAEVVTAEDAEFVINGTTVTRGSNVVDDAISGVTLELIAETTTTAQVRVSDDVEALRESMQGYVDAFNNVAGQIERQLSLSGAAASEGSLFGDSTLKLLQRQLGSLASGSFGDDSARLADFGIEIGRSGSLTLDTDTFDGAVAGGPLALIDLLEGPTGLSASISDLAEVYTDSVDGLLSAKEDSIQSLLDTLDRQVDDINEDADSLQTRLSREFSALEQLMANLNAQQSQLTAILG